MFTSPRAAWMLRYFGAKNVKILNGGLKKWVAEGRDFINDP
jgi:thiosulfate/3-mercaptopyruvate sulfurtransferase